MEKLLIRTEFWEGVFACDQFPLRHLPSLHNYHRALELNELRLG